MKHRSISQRILAALLTIVMLSSVVLPGLPVNNAARKKPVESIKAL